MTTFSQRIRAAVVFCLLVPALACTTGCDRNTHPRQLGQPAPAFAISDGEQSLDLAKLRGHVVVLNFWAAWCITCLQELPSLEQLHHNEGDIRVVSVSIDDDTTVYHAFMTRRHVDIPSVLNGPQGVNLLYNTLNPPETYILDKQGVIRRKFIGPQDWTSPEMLTFLRKLSAA